MIKILHICLYYPIGPRILFFKILNLIFSITIYLSYTFFHLPHLPPNLAYVHEFLLFCLTPLPPPSAQPTPPQTAVNLLREAPYHFTHM